MTEPTLQQVLGVGATQDATTITILKANLTDLSAAANNTAESLLVAIVLKAKAYLTTANQDLNPDQSVTLTDGFAPSFAVRNNVTYRQDDITISLQKSAGNTTIDPDDY